MAGGAATTSGTTFQEDVAAWLACLILAEERAPSILGVPSSVALQDMVAESTQPVDDLKVTTSVGGQLFLQCKTSPSLSENDIQFSSALDQFARQYHEGYKPPGAPRRPLDLGRDRLVLAVSHRAPATIRDGLRDLLDGIRSCESLEILAQVRSALSEETRSRLELIERMLRQNLNQAEPSCSSEEEVLAILRLIHVLPLHIESDGHDRREADGLLRQCILEDPARANDAWNLVLATVRQFSPARSGGDRRFFRRVLQDAGLMPNPASSARQAIDTVKARSRVYERHLSRFASIPFRGQQIKIARPIVDAILQEAAGGLLVIGTAGAGKSGCLHDFVTAARSNGADVLLLAVGRLAADSPGGLDHELHLPGNRSLVEVLTDWTGSAEAFLVIDALDAARTTHGLRMLCDLIEQIRRHAPRWRVVASIREFDLRHSRDVQRLFHGTCDVGYTSPEFADVRHLFVEPLTDEELAAFAKDAPEVAAARDAASPELKELTRSPFNLRLLADLVERQVEAVRLSHVRTQIGLLDVYWDERVASVLGEGDLQAGLTTCVRLMVDERKLSIGENRLAELGASPGQWLDRLASLGVLSVAEGIVPGSERTVAFVHNILYDYAVARLLLRELPTEVMDWLGETANQDLLLAIRPSVILAFQRLWYASSDRKPFWERAVCLAASPSIRLIGKIIAAHVAATEYQVLDDVRPLLGRLGGSDDEAARQLLQYTWQAAFTNHQRDPRRFPFWGEGAPEWLGLADHLTEHHPDAATWQVRALLALLLPR
jgi:hypothetical protein